MTDAEKLAAIFKQASDMGVNEDEYAVGLAAEVLSVVDGTVSYEAISDAARYPQRTMGDALAAAREAVRAALQE